MANWTLNDGNWDTWSIVWNEPDSDGWENPNGDWDTGLDISWNATAIIATASDLSLSTNDATISVVGNKTIVIAVPSSLSVAIEDPSVTLEITTYITATEVDLDLLAAAATVNAGFKITAITSNMSLSPVNAEIKTDFSGTVTAIPAGLSLSPIPASITYVFSWADISDQDATWAEDVDATTPWSGDADEDSIWWDVYEVNEDPGFDNPSDWRLNGSGGQVTNGQLQFSAPLYAFVNDNPSNLFEVGKVYKYEIDVGTYDLQSGAVKVALIKAGNVEIYNKDGAGRFVGTFVAQAGSQGIYFSAHGFSGDWYINSISIVKDFVPEWTVDSDEVVSWNEQADKSSTWSSETDTTSAWNKDADETTVWAKDTDKTTTWAKEPNQSTSWE